jgi:hypothetical protein
MISYKCRFKRHFIFLQSSFWTLFPQKAAHISPAKKIAPERLVREQIS